MEPKIIHYNKLVRDKVIAKLERLKIYHTFHIANNLEFEEKLFSKIPEEIAEFLESKGAIEEYIDIKHVLEAWADHRGWTAEYIEQKSKEKLDKEGGLKDRIILDDCEEKSP
ncbi:MAG TPA: nucleoside triphosphate pyrophosphohydrolase [Candidatus Paceibacterota bacterium]|jgi:predicted house-cleaning noncanonical NTP pyrophosphatase (MazG superfamily)|nr:nucleoside triphosphate pyrophosphohydrolase [Candidatus Paceibacterota bacterium]